MSIPAEVLRAFSLPEGRVAPITQGHINETFSLTAEGREWIVQALNHIFEPKVHDAIPLMEVALREAGMACPRFRRTREGALWTRAGGKIWRIMTRIDGEAPDRVNASGLAHEAGRGLGAFHRAMKDVVFPPTGRKGVHDTPRHMAKLRDQLELAANLDHPLHADAKACAAEILDTFGKLAPLPARGAHAVHGDPKITNILFKEGAFVCFIDFDTLGMMNPLLEIGDALRSWCNAALEDDPDARLQDAWLEAAMEGYEEGGGYEGLGGHAPLALATIAIELSARFCADIWEESYFGWDRSRYGRAGEHHLRRTRGQMRLAEQALALL